MRWGLPPTFQKIGGVVVGMGLHTHIHDRGPNF